MKIKIVAPGVELFIIVLASFMKLDDNLVHKHCSSSQTLTSRYHTINCVLNQLSKINFPTIFLVVDESRSSVKKFCWLVGIVFRHVIHYTARQHQLPSYPYCNAYQYHEPEFNSSDLFQLSLAIVLFILLLLSIIVRTYQCNFLLLFYNKQIRVLQMYIYMTVGA